MRQKCFFSFHFMLAYSLVFAQLPKSTDLAALSFVKKGSVKLRWAPGNLNLWKAGNSYGYKIERILFDQYMEPGPDSVKYKGAVSFIISPWKQTDTRWKALIEKNRSASVLFNSLYTPGENSGAQKKEMLFGLLLKSCDLYNELAMAGGLTMIDSAFDASQVYVYRVSLYNAPKTLKYAPAVLAVNPKEISELSKIETLKAKFSDRKAVLSFVTLGGKDYGGYWIERSEDSLNFKAVNRSPFIRSTTQYDEKNNESAYKDSLPVNNKKYHYRVRGISLFGEVGPASNMVSGKGKPDFMEYPLIDSVLIIKNASVVLKFRMPDLFDRSLLRGYLVYRSEKKNGVYAVISKVLPPEITVFSDDQALESNYYKVCAINNYNDSAYSMSAYAKLIDETPPLVPTEPTGSIDSAGIVRLSWVGNTDKDLLGYRVYRANSEKEQPVELTEKLLMQTSFTDTVSLKTLTKEVFYTLRAVDKVYNNSGYSKYCKLTRPDKIAPVAIVFEKIWPTDSTIILNWLGSSSDDVKKYRLHKKENAGVWRAVKEWGVDDSLIRYTDSALVAENTYQYKMETIDGSGNTSVTETHMILFKPAFLPKIKEFRAKVSLEKRSIELQWSYGNKSVYNYTLYKAKGNEPLKIYKTLDNKTEYFIDKELYPNNKYHYSLKATTQSGSETKLSDILGVEF